MTDSPFPASGGSDNSETPNESFPGDVRLYAPEAENWRAHILTSWDKVYCFAKHPGQDYYHQLMYGEIYVQKGDEVYCLNCALRDGILTRNRLYWQKGSGLQ
jgi:hypothetical protein